MSALADRAALEIVAAAEVSAFLGDVSVGEPGHRAEFFRRSRQFCGKSRERSHLKIIGLGTAVTSNSRTVSDVLVRRF